MLIEAQHAERERCDRRRLSILKSIMRLRARRLFCTLFRQDAPRLSDARGDAIFPRSSRRCRYYAYFTHHALTSRCHPGFERSGLIFPRSPSAAFDAARPGAPPAFTIPLSRLIAFRPPPSMLTAISLFHPLRPEISPF
jgi:hypothetical protein